MPGTAPGGDAGPLRLVLDWGPRLSLLVTNLGLACCAVEFVAASMASPGLLPRRAGVGPTREELSVLVVSGTVSDKMAPSVVRLHEQLPEPRAVLSFGACANSGGPYWDSYCVTKGVDQLRPGDVWVPGGPPRPEALLEGLRVLLEHRYGPAPGAAPGSGSAPLLLAAGPEDLRRTLPGASLP